MSAYLLIDIDGLLVAQDDVVGTHDGAWWVDFYLTQDGAPRPFTQVVDLIRGMLRLGYKPLFLTGRSDNERILASTRLLLRDLFGITTPMLVCRQEHDDARSCLEVKREVLGHLLNHYPVAMAFEDEPEIFDYYTRRGVPCMLFNGRTRLDTPRTVGAYEHAVVLGRMQPPHRGHMWLIEQAARQAKHTWVFLGTGQQDAYNPFSFEQRMGWLQQALPHLAVTYVRNEMHADDVAWERETLTEFRSHGLLPTNTVLVSAAKPNVLAYETRYLADYPRHHVSLQEGYEGSTVRDALRCGRSIRDLVSPLVYREVEEVNRLVHDKR